jgi:hypothetical protein
MPSPMPSEDPAAGSKRRLFHGREPTGPRLATIHSAGPASTCRIPEAARKSALEQCREGDQLHWIAYRPQRECFFHGDDPLNSARQTPGLMWGRVFAPEPLPPLGELDTYSCLLGFDLLTNAPREELDQYYRYLPDQVEITAVPALMARKGTRRNEWAGQSVIGCRSGPSTLGGRRGRR